MTNLSKMSEYKFSLLNQVAFLYTNSMLPKEEIDIMDAFPFTIAPKTIKYLNINLTKEIVGL